MVIAPNAPAIDRLSPASGPSQTAPRPTLSPVTSSSAGTSRSKPIKRPAEHTAKQPNDPRARERQAQERKKKEKTWSAPSRHSSNRNGRRRIPPLAGLAGRLALAHRNIPTRHMVSSVGSRQFLAPPSLAALSFLPPPSPSEHASANSWARFSTRPIGGRLSARLRLRAARQTDPYLIKLSAAATAVGKK